MAGSADASGSTEQGGSVDPVDDERWLVVDGRRWRRQDPALPEDVARRLLSHLGRGRSGVRALRAAGEDAAPARRRVDLAKHGLGERGTPWWEQSPAERRARWADALQVLDGLDPPDDKPRD
nr:MULTISPECIES: 2-polyprenylphenol hydroxylase [unclassified Ornithinimicrobium]